MNIKILTVICFSVLLIFACRKYEEGHVLSLKTKESRLIGKWKLSSYEREYTEDGVKKVHYFKEGDSVQKWNLNYDSSKMVKYYEFLTINKEGTCVFEFPTYYNDYFRNTSYWQLEDRKKIFTLLSPALDGQITKKYTILKLTEEEYIIQDDKTKYTYIKY